MLRMLCRRLRHVRKYLCLRDLRRIIAESGNDDPKMRDAAMRGFIRIAGDYGGNSLAERYRLAAQATGFALPSLERRALVTQEAAQVVYG